MKSIDEIKNMVREKYATIARQSLQQNKSSCCGSGNCSSEVYNIMTEDYSTLSGYVPNADLGLGCGLPTEFARIKPGDTVVDLGSGAGNDCFVARQETGPTGMVVGVDFTPEMVEKARNNARKLGFDNVTFIQGDIEQLPLNEHFADVVVSNCVLNLVPDKGKAYKEVFRILKPGGHFSISDVVLEGNIPDRLRQQAELYAGCVSGAVTKPEYLSIIYNAGFTPVDVQKYRNIVIPDDILTNHLSPEELDLYRSGAFGIFSMTLSGVKPV
ncbi:MAG: arsenite methyltransferase [Saprospiraceae bacterium]|nr:arsenite methyltransferase [Saprospiraceae bacterium]